MNKVIVALISLIWINPLHAYETQLCVNDTNYRIAYPNDDVWHLNFDTNMPNGGWSQTAVLNAFATWNGVYGAYDILSKNADGQTQCFSDGIGVVAWDDGSCETWPPNADGMAHWFLDGCTITRFSVFFNTAFTWTAARLERVALHEFGHYIYAAHEFQRLSIMGYYLGTNADPQMLFLTADDHQFIRAYFSSGNTALADLAVHRFVQLDTPISGMSYTYADGPVCSGNGCKNLKKGDTISVEVTIENAGGVATDNPVKIKMYLNNYVIGTWKTSNVMGSGAQGKNIFKGTVPSGIPNGTYALKIKIDPDNEVTNKKKYSSSGPASITYKEEMKLLAPSDWTCYAGWYDANDGCDCECGLYDPDCYSDSFPSSGCDSFEATDCLEVFCNTSAHCSLRELNISCDDGINCTENDKCQSGTCIGTPLDCSMLNDQCNTGKCDEDYGDCYQESLYNGKSCDDNDSCTQKDKCDEGFCKGIPTDCSSLTNQCRIGYCDQENGACNIHNQPDGRSCDDGREETINDKCEAGICRGEEKSVTPVCGNGIKEEGEQCDDGNMTPGDGCEPDCTLPATSGGTCGNGIKESYEQCDDGNMTPGDGCNPDCTIPGVAGTCGNGIKEWGEDCDDGNLSAGDSCNPDCTKPAVSNEISGATGCGCGIIDF